MTAHRILSGISELDKMLNGGFLPGDAVMVAGSAGTGKSTLAMQYIVNGVKLSKQNGIYITFEQIPEQIYRDAKNFGWDLKKLEEDKRIKVICTSPDVLLKEEGRQAVFGDDVIKEIIHPSRVVIDSLSHLSICTGEKKFRREMYRLIMFNVVKMRGSNHDKRLREYEIDERGLHVMPEFTNYEGVMTGLPTKVAQDRFTEALERVAKKVDG